VNGRIHVAVVVRHTSAAIRQALAAAGLTIERLDEATIVGWIDVDKLTALAELDGVEHVTIAKEAVAPG